MGEVSKRGCALARLAGRKAETIHTTRVYKREKSRKTIIIICGSACEKQLLD